jgi:hypothetical protein
MESIKQADRLPPLIFNTPSPHKYNNYPDASFNKIHMVDTEFQLTFSWDDHLCFNSGDQLPAHAMLPSMSQDPL